MHRPDNRRAATWLLALFAMQWLLFAALSVPTWDGVFYYAYARSPVFDGDLHFANDIVAAYPTAGDQFPLRALDQVETATGYINNVFPPGAAAVWLPWVALARAGAGVAGMPVSGYEGWFVATAAALSMWAGLTAYWLVFRVAAALVGQNAALFATSTLMLATPVLHYQFNNPFYSHVASLLAIALLVAVWWPRHAAIERWAGGLLLGALVGLAALVRWQYVLYGALPALSAALWWWQLPPDRRRAAVWPALRYLLAVGAGALLLFSIQMAIWQTLFGSWLTIPQGEGFMSWDMAYLWPLLVSPFRGLLAWMPIFFPALAGLLWLARRRPTLGVPLLVVLLLQLYVNSSLPDWFAGGGFGPRRFSGEVALLAIGYACLLGQLPARARWPVGGLAALLFAWHQITLLRYGLAEQLGGRVMSMAPDFRWQESGWFDFAATLLARMGRALTQPADFWHFPYTPLAIGLGGAWPWQQIIGLVVAALVWATVIWVLCRAARLRTRPRLLIGLTAVAILLIDGWILFMA